MYWVLSDRFLNYWWTYNILVLFVNRRTRNTGAELPVELGTWPEPVTKIRHWWICEKPFDLLLNLSTRSGVTIYRYRLSLW